MLGGKKNGHVWPMPKRDFCVMVTLVQPRCHKILCPIFTLSCNTVLHFYRFHTFVKDSDRLWLHYAALEIWPVQEPGRSSFLIRMHRIVGLRRVAARCFTNQDGGIVKSEKEALNAKFHLWSHQLTLYIGLLRSFCTIPSKSQCGRNKRTVQRCSKMFKVQSRLCHTHTHVTAQQIGRQQRPLFRPLLISSVSATE